MIRGELSIEQMRNQVAYLTKKLAACIENAKSQTYMSQYKLLKDISPLYLLKLKKREELTKDVEEWHDFYDEADSTQSNTAQNKEAQQQKQRKKAESESDVPSKSSGSAKQQGRTDAAPTQPKAGGKVQKPKNSPKIIPDYVKEMM